MKEQSGTIRAADTQLDVNMIEPAHAQRCTIIDKTDELREEMYEMADKYERKIERIQEFWKEKM